MKMNKPYRLWLSIIATNAISLSMIFLSIKSTLIESFNHSKKNHKDNFVFTDSQLHRLRKKNAMTVAIVEDKAYWVDGNVFYETDVVNGEIVRENAKQVDAFNLSSKQFSYLLDILDNIT